MWSHPRIVRSSSHSHTYEKATRGAGARGLGELNAGIHGSWGLSVKNGEGDDKAAADEQAFNETLKRMLKTPPKPHEKSTAPTKPDQAEKHRKND